MLATVTDKPPVMAWRILAIRWATELDGLMRAADGATDPGPINAVLAAFKVEAARFLVMDPPPHARRDFDVFWPLVATAAKSSADLAGDDPGRWTIWVRSIVDIVKWSQAPESAPPIVH